jgi:hypothetical protein
MSPVSVQAALQQGRSHSGPGMAVRTRSAQDSNPMKRFPKARHLGKVRFIRDLQRGTAIGSEWHGCCIHLLDAKDSAIPRWRFDHPCVEWSN